MSYEKAMKHARNVRKCRAQGRMYFGFASSSGQVKAVAAHAALGPLTNIRRWFHDRQSYTPGTPAYRHLRECIREQIDEYRAAMEASAVQG